MPTAARLWKDGRFLIEGNLTEGGGKFSLNQAGNLSVKALVEKEPNLWPDPDMDMTPDYNVKGAVAVSRGTDDGIYHQKTFTNTTNTYVGYDVTTLESGAQYIWTAEVWRSAGSDPKHVTLAVEQAPAVQSNGPAWSSIPEATWTQVSAFFTADPLVRLLFYPTGSTAGSGTFRWRNVSVRKLPTKPMSVSPEWVTVGEFAE